MIKYLKNNTLNSKIIVGIYFEPGEYRRVDKNLEFTYLADETFIADMVSGAMIVAFSTDGTTDTPAEHALQAFSTSGV